MFFLDIAAGLASLGTSHVTDAKQLPRTKTPDGPEHDEVTCSQTCLKQVYPSRQHIYCIQGHCVAGLQPPGIAYRTDRPAVVQSEGASSLPPVPETHSPHPETFGRWKDLPSQLLEVTRLCTVPHLWAQMLDLLNWFKCLQTRSFWCK